MHTVRQCIFTELEYRVLLNALNGYLAGDPSVGDMSWTLREERAAHTARDKLLARKCPRPVTRVQKGAL